MTTSIRPTALDTVEAYVAALGRGDMEAVFALLDPEVEWFVPGDAALVPWAGRRTGHAAMRAWFPLLAGAGERKDFELYGMAVLGSDHVLVNGRFVFRMHATGAVYDDEFVMRFTVRDGRITAYRIYEDSLALAHAYRG
ncbi:nuclear transport factor 2 family protein [Streptomyces cinnamoneus]|uniref:Ketosteroid isomerase n=1 Tax=Streptomyces cinnamoneus TaxID=53446 RepID=A0A918TCY3_STRCJ|nr:nuclear transport factor 2 family protein [Streptomyces cinnamoneus]GHC39497.1 ketosteroid isomerase [Streptomyces cinnamoneus]